jgi:hypothetical protein
VVRVFEGLANQIMLCLGSWYCNSDKLWVSLLQHKYVNDKLFLYIPTTLGSTLWNSIMKAKATLLNGFNYRLRYGSSSFWYAPWTKFGKPCEQVLYVDTHDVHLIISYVI